MPSLGTSLIAAFERQRQAEIPVPRRPEDRSAEGWWPPAQRPRRDADKGYALLWTTNVTYFTENWCGDLSDIVARCAHPGPLDGTCRNPPPGQLSLPHFSFLSLPWSGFPGDNRPSCRCELCGSRSAVTASVSAWWTATGLGLLWTHTSEATH